MPNIGAGPIDSLGRVRRQYFSDNSRVAFGAQGIHGVGVQFNLLRNKLPLSLLPFPNYLTKERSFSMMHLSFAITLGMMP